MAKLLLTPERTRFEVNRSEETIAVELDGGLPKLRRDIINGAFKIPVRWRCNPSQYRYLNAFYETELDFGSRTFTIDLLINDAIEQTYTAQFEPGTMKLAGNSGLTYVVNADLVVQPNTYNHAQNQAIIDAFTADQKANLLSIDVPPDTVGTDGIPPDLVNSVDDIINQGFAIYFTNPNSVPSQFSASGLPAGLSIDPSTSVVTGTVEGVLMTYITQIIYAPIDSGFPVSVEFEWAIV